MNQRLQSAIEAYRDGELPPRRHRAAERQLAEDGEAQRYLRSGEALSRLVRESWSEGPPAPPAERFLAAIRPELARIDAERARRAAERDAASWLRGWKLGWTEWLRPLPIGGISAFAGAAAVALLAFSSLQPRAPESPSTAGRFGSSLSVYAQAPLAGEDEPIYDSDVQLIGDGYGKTARAPFSSSTSIYDVHQGDGGLLIYDGEDDSPLLIFALPDEAADGDDSLFQPAVLGGSNS